MRGRGMQAKWALLSGLLFVGVGSAWAATSVQRDWRGREITVQAAQGTVATPTFSPGAPYTFSDSVKVTISCATSGATIRYTTNGADPTSSSTVYSGPLTLTATTTLKARAFKTGMTNSGVATGTYTGAVATPTFSPAAPYSFNDSVKVTISCTTSGATIRYTTNGSNPASSSTVYSGPLTFTTTTTLKAKAFRTGMNDSGVASGTYTMPPKNVTFTQSHHPLLTSPKSARGLYNDGAKLLLVDDDGPGDGGLNDDVSLDVRFTITTAAQATFPNQSGSSFPSAQRYNYTLPVYNDIPNDAVGDQLRNATFAQIKQVNRGHDFTGWSNPSNRTIILSQAANAQTTVHEWGHLCGLSHRDDPKAIMYSVGSTTKNEINTTERAAMLRY